jgi:hypothetical protein
MVSGFKLFEDNLVVVSEPQFCNNICDLASLLLFWQEKPGYWLPLPGDPIRRESNQYDQIYYTYHATSALLDLGFPLNFKPLQAAFRFFDSFPGVSINYRPFYYLYIPLGLLSEEKIIQFLRILKKFQTKKEQREEFAGSFLLPQGWLDESKPETYWKDFLHPGGHYFHACHLGFLVSQISEKDFPAAINLKRQILDDVRDFLHRAVLKFGGRLPYSDGTFSPDLTLWLYLLADPINLALPPNWIENLEWATQAKPNSLLFRCLTTMNFLRLAKKHSFAAKIQNLIDDYVSGTIHELENLWESIIRNPRDASIALRTYLRIGNYYDDGFRHRIFSYLLKHFLEY